MKSNSWAAWAFVAIALLVLRRPVSAVAVAALAEAIGYVESRGDYSKVSPVNLNGSIAYGKYQILDSNIPAWTAAAVGTAYSPAAFLAQPDVQDATAYNKIAQLLSTYRDPADVAAVWFSGKPLDGNTAQDVTGTTVPQYVAAVLGQLGIVLG